MVPTPAHEAFDRLQKEGLVIICTSLLAEGGGKASFDFEMKVPHPNSQGLPSHVKVKAVFPEAFPKVRAEFYLVDPETWRFPHMALKDGHLCLKVGQEHLWDPFESLLQSILEVLEWLEDAAQGMLLKQGSPWELPDFRVDAGKGPVSLPVWSMESSESFGEWKDQIGKHGDVLLRLHADKKSLVPTRFNLEGGVVVASLQPTPSFLDRTTTIRAKWFILPSLIHTSHRPPRTFDELMELCAKAGFSFWDILASGARLDTYLDRYYILAGAPIPAIVGSPPNEIHWQPIALPEKWVKSVKADRGGIPKRQWLKDLLGTKQIPWGKLVNISPKRLGARGHLPEEVIGKKTCIIGCGAIGSMLVDLLIRGGIRDMAMFDPENIEIENLCRHVLGPSDVDDFKALALEKRYKAINPANEVRGYATLFPLPTSVGHNKEWREILQADALIDCTANEAVFIWISKQGRERDKRVFHLFTNPYARILTLCCSGRHTSCAEVYGLLIKDIKNGVVPIDWNEYNPKCDEVPLGAGCWHPAFPALGSDLYALVASVIPFLTSLLNVKWASQGRAIVLRRNEIDITNSEGGPVPVIEVVWNHPYRKGI